MTDDATDGADGQADPTARRRAIVAGYDDVAGAYDAERTDESDEHALLDDLADELDADARILDVGCGGGRPVLTRFAAAYDVVGLDVSTEQLRRARDAADAPTVRGDAVQLPLERDVVDAVTAFHSIIHVPSDQHEDVVREVARVLRPGGRFLFSTGGEAWTGTNPDWLGAGSEMHWSFPGLEATRGLLTDAGFEIETEVRADNEMDDGAWPFLLARLTDDGA